MSRKHAVGATGVEAWRIVAIVVGLALAVGCGHPSDEELLSLFESEQAQLEKVRQMMLFDEKLVCVDRVMYSPLPLPRTLRKPGPELSRERWNEYKRLFDEIGLEQGVCRPWSEDEDRKLKLFYTVSTRGFLLKSTDKGIVYLESPPGSLVASLDELPEGAGEWYRKIRGNWYLYGARD